jgi:hypothetical protein
METYGGNRGITLLIPKSVINGCDETVIIQTYLPERPLVSSIDVTPNEKVKTP